MSALAEQQARYKAVRQRLMNPAELLRQDVRNANKRAELLEKQLEEAHEEIRRLGSSLEDMRRFIRPGTIGVPSKGQRPVEEIINDVLHAFPAITFKDVRSPNRMQEVYQCRAEIMWQLHRQRHDLSMAKIGKIVNRDHSCVVRVVKRRNQEIAEESRAAA